jgi:hypothetical protein
MKRSIRSVLAVVLAGLVAAPAAAEQATLRLPPLAPARKGDDVVVTLRDGREIHGEVGRWVEDVGFYVKPTDSTAWLIHPEDIVGLRDAASGRALSVPVRHSGLSASSKTLIGIGVFFIGFVIWGRAVGLGGG